jgi:hypothetical protein
MIVSFLAIASITGSPFPPSEAYAAIFSDIFLNAMIGNGNLAVTYDWAYGLDNSKAPRLKIDAIMCQQTRRLPVCQFDLVRIPHAAASDADKALHRRLSCSASFRRQDNGEAGWEVKHLRPRRGGGHSRTTMRCEAAYPESGVSSGENPTREPSN